MGVFVSSCNKRYLSFLLQLAEGRTAPKPVSTLFLAGLEGNYSLFVVFLHSKEDSSDWKGFCHDRLDYRSMAKQIALLGAKNLRPSTKKGFRSMRESFLIWGYLFFF
ncbi:MAG: hypothetical protein IK005_12770 [Paludibacteraceae bacterium]|nr:hypothetical protein [Paludibacteraceae bacterium]